MKYLTSLVFGIACLVVIVSSANGKDEMKQLRVRIEQLEAKLNQLSSCCQGTTTKPRTKKTKTTKGRDMTSTTGKRSI